MVASENQALTAYMTWDRVISGWGGGGGGGGGGGVGGQGWLSIHMALFHT